MIVSSSSIFCIAALVFSSIERVYFRVDPPTFRYICLQLVSAPMAAATFFQGMPFARMSFINFNSYEDHVVFRTLLCAIFSTSSLLIVPSTRSNRIFEISSSTDFFCPFAALTPPTINGRPRALDSMKTCTYLRVRWRASVILPHVAAREASVMRAVRSIERH